MKNKISNTYAFVHIEKAAGTSLIHAIRRQFFLRYADVRPLFLRDTDELTADDLRLFGRMLPRLHFISGHSVAPYSDLEKVLPNLKYLSIVREPISRLESHFTHWAQRKGHTGSFSEFLSEDSMRNFMCKKISGNDDVGAAIEILESKFVAVGVFEDMARFYQMLRLQVPELSALSLPQHSNKRRLETKVEISDSLRDDIVRLNESDIKLYDWIKKSSLSGSDLGSSDTGVDNQSSKVLDYADYALRKLWLEPVSGVIRVVNGLPYRGSYQKTVYG